MRRSITMKNFSDFLDMRRYKNWVHKIAAAHDLIIVELDGKWQSVTDKINSHLKNIYGYGRAPSFSKCVVGVGRHYFPVYGWVHQPGSSPTCLLFGFYGNVFTWAWSFIDSISNLFLFHREVIISPDPGVIQELTQSYLIGTKYAPIILIR